MPWRCSVHQWAAGDAPPSSSCGRSASHEPSKRRPSTCRIPSTRGLSLRTPGSSCKRLCGAAAREPQTEGFQASSLDASSSARTGWHPLASAVTWKVEEENAMFKTPLPAQLAPTWKLMLLSDGSVTRHLQLLTGQRVAVDCLEMAGIGDELRGLPQGTDLIQGPRVQRQVFLRLPGENGNGASSGATLAYAASWWSADQVNEYLKDRQQPIWASLSATRTELYRDIQAVYYGHSPFLTREFQQPGPFWGRQYIFWHNGQPLTLIYEVFSPALQQLLGPSEHPSASL